MVHFRNNRWRATRPTEGNHVLAGRNHYESWCSYLHMDPNSTVHHTAQSRCRQIEMCFGSKCGVSLKEQRELFAEFMEAI